MALPVRVVIVIALMLASVGCYKERTLSPEEAAAQRAQNERESKAAADRARADPRANNRAPEAHEILETPIYDSPIDIVQSAVVLACKKRFDHVDVDDRTAHRVEVKSQTAWAGSSDVIVQLTTNAKQQTVVEISSDADASGRPARDIRAIISNLDQEMSRLALAGAGVGDAPAKPTAEVRLRELEDLRGKGLVTDEEYQAKRKAIIDGL